MDRAAETGVVSGGGNIRKQRYDSRDVFPAFGDCRDCSQHYGAFCVHGSIPKEEKKAIKALRECRGIAAEKVPDQIKNDT